VINHVYQKSHKLLAFLLDIDIENISKDDNNLIVMLGGAKPQAACFGGHWWSSLS
jgi:hypothetical protein